jgi:copper chaperone
MMKLDLTVPSMACSACADTISKAVTAIDPAATIAADPKTKQVVIETELPESSVKQAIEAAGYPVA